MLKNIKSALYFHDGFKKYQKETLQEPVAADSNDDHVPQENHEDCDDCNNGEEQRTKLV